MHYKISVIIPVYGVEKYIERCSRSLFEQSLNEIEFIFVNDSTQDNSMSILNEVLAQYPQRKNQVKIIKHEQNKGLPQARKTGVLMASGEYIAHCDSDDWLEKDMYEVMYNEAKILDYDIVTCDYYKSDGDVKKYVRPYESQKYLQGPVWNKIVKRTIYTDHDIIYPTANKAEDGALLTQLSFYGQKRKHVNKALYYYYNNPDSMCRVISKENCVKRLHEECENVELRRDFLIKHNCLPADESCLLGWEYLSRKNLMPYITEKDIYSLWKNTYSELNHRFISARGIRWQTKLHFLLVYYKQFWILQLLGQL